MNQLYHIYIFGALTLLPLTAKGELVIVVNSLPANTPPGAVIYLSGSINQWTAADPAMKLELNASGKYQVKVQPPIGPVHFTFTCGSWAHSEGNSTGEYQAMHVVQYTGQAQTVYVDIRSWRNTAQTAFNSDKRGTVAVLEDSMYMPQLNRTRRIFIYLPPNYYATPTKRYPVLYLQDGQFLFQKAHPQGEEWEIDESLDKLVGQGNHGCIAVGIENGGVNQMNEYVPWFNASHNVGGQGGAYMNFIVNTLRPFINQHFRTLSDREHTGIGGSSFGALISLFGALEHQDVFSKVLLFSPAFWFSDVALQNHILGKGKRFSTKMYFLVGGQEPSYVVQSLQNTLNALRFVGFSGQEVAVDVPAEGKAIIPFWQKNFPTAYLWLFPGLASSTNESDATSMQALVSVYPNPATDWIRIRSGREGEEWQVQIVGLDGALKRDTWVYGEDAIPVYDLPSGPYFVRIRSAESSDWQTAKWVKR